MNPFKFKIIFSRNI